MEDKKKIGRKAGVLYLLLGITGMLGILYIPSQIIVPGDAAATAGNIMSKELLYRAGIVCQLTCQTLFVYLVLVLHRLFKAVDENYSLQMVTLVVVSVPITFVIMVFQLAAPVLLGNADMLAAFTQAQLNSLAFIFFNLYEAGIVVAQVFWGLWLIPFGLLSIKSGFIPRFIGVFLVIGGVGYVLASLAGLLLPGYGASIGQIVTIPSAIGEFSMIFWLLKGVKAPELHDTKLQPSLSAGALTDAQ